MGTRSGCEAGGSAPDSPASGGQDHLPEAAWLMGKEGLVMGQVRAAGTVFQLSHQAAAPPTGPSRLTLGPEAVSILFGVFNLTTKVYGIWEKLKM